MKKTIKKVVKTIPQVKRLIHERDSLLKERNSYIKFVPPGHFYSPIPSEKDIDSLRDKDLPMQIAGVDLNEEGQLKLLEELKQYYSELPFSDEKVDNLRYFYKNSAYSYGDAIVLYSMIRHLRPKRLIEVGSGYSSCVTLDTNELFFENKIECKFIEPYPELLESLIKKEDKTRIEIKASKLQDIHTDYFKDLQANDILFIDSTHVSKLNSDVNYIIHEILPILNSGVYIHIHDIFYPFEYPLHWLEEGRAWNEIYILRAFLQFNQEFKIVAFNSYLGKLHKEVVETNLPLMLKNIGGSIWLLKT